jgi:hypothetical protein
MPNIYSTTKGGRSGDSSDILAQIKKNTLIQDIASKKALGIYKPTSNNYGFNGVHLQARTGLDSILNAKKTPESPPIPPLATNPTALDVPPGTGIPFSSTLNTPTSLHVFESSGGGGATDAVFANGIWVLSGKPSSTSTADFYYGPSLTNLLPLNLFGIGTKNTYVATIRHTYPSAVYANSTWVFCGEDTKTSLSYNVCYGPDPANLKYLSIFGNTGNALFATYGGGNWVICGLDTSGSGFNVYYGPSPDNLRPLAIFGAGGFASHAAYANGTWVIVGDANSGRNSVYYGSNLANLTPLSLLESSSKVRYLDNKWIICGYNGGVNNVPLYFYGTDLANLTAGQILPQNSNASCLEVAFANNTWVLGFNTNSVFNLAYGATLNSLTPVSMFLVGGNAKSIVYGNGVWGICGTYYDPNINLQTSIYYGANIAALTPKLTPLSNFLVFQNGIWVAGGDNTATGNNLIFGPNLANI